MALWEKGKKVCSNTLKIYWWNGKLKIFENFVYFPTFNPEKV